MTRDTKAIVQKAVGTLGIFGHIILPYMQSFLIYGRASQFAIADTKHRSEQISFKLGHLKIVLRTPVRTPSHDNSLDF